LSLQTNSNNKEAQATQAPKLIIISRLEPLASELIIIGSSNLSLQTHQGKEEKLK
jgi:hypothetical protein